MMKNTTTIKLCYIGMPHEYEDLIPGELYILYRRFDGYYQLIDSPKKYKKEQFFIYYPETCLGDYDLSHWEEIYGDWTIPELAPKIDEGGRQYAGLRLRRLTPLLTDDRIQEIDLNTIQWMGFDLPDRLLYENCFCCDGKRTEDANLNQLGLLLDGTTTYSGRRYRSMDGKHRIQKAILQGFTSFKFYVFHIDEIKGYFSDYPNLMNYFPEDRNHPEEDH